MLSIIQVATSKPGVFKKDVTMEIEVQPTKKTSTETPEQ